MQLCFGIIEMRKKIRQKRRDFLHSLSTPLLFLASTARTDGRRHVSINNTVDTANTGRTLHTRGTAASIQPSMFLLPLTLDLLERIFRNPSQRFNGNLSQVGDARLSLAILLGLSGRGRRSDASFPPSHETPPTNAASQVGASGTTSNTSQHRCRISS
jgi:hypothetical protein